MKETLILRSSIRPRLLHKILMRGFFIALIGGLAIVLAGAFLSATFLQMWGFLIFISSLTLIALGLLPYRRLAKLASKPNEIHVLGYEMIEYYTQGQKMALIPCKAIKKMAYLENAEMRGIGIWIDPTEKESVILDPAFNINGFHHQFDCDFFFPFFSQISYEELKDWFEGSPLPIITECEPCQ